MQTVEVQTTPRLSEDALERRARQALALFEGIDDAVIVHDLEGRILDVNPAVCRRLGYSRDELLRMTTRDIDEPRFAAGFDQRLRQQLTTGRLSCEGWHVTRTGQLIPVDINASVIHLDGQPAVLAVVRDITERKTSERRLLGQYAVTRVLAEAVTLAEAAPKILQGISDCLGCDVGVLWTVDREAEALCCVDVWQSPHSPAPGFEALTRQSVFLPGVGLPGRVWATGQSIWITDVLGDTNFPRVSMAAREGLHGAFGFPILSGGATIGVIEFFSRQVSDPDDLLLSLIAALGSQIGQFIERKRGEDELKKINAFLDSMVENVPSMLFVKDAAKLRFERVNRAAEKLLGIRREDLIGKNDYDFFPREQADFFTEKDREVLRTNKPLAITEEIETRDGRKVFFTRKMPILDDEGHPKYLLGISEDITERIALDNTRREYAQAQLRYAQELEEKNQALIESEARSRQLIEAALDGIAVANQNGRILFFNPAAERIFGYTASEIIGKNLKQLIPQDFPQVSQHVRERLQKTAQCRDLGETLELHGRRQDGTDFPMEVSLTAFDWGGEVQYLGTIRDLTERNRLRARMVQSEKLASIGLLSAGVAHEINNPLAYVANNLVVLDRDVKGLLSLLTLYEGARAGLAQVDPATAQRAAALAEDIDLSYVRDNLDRIFTRTREGVQRVAKIVQSLRGLARTDRPQLEEVTLSDLIESSLEMIRGRLQRRGVQVRLEYGDLPKARCVASQIGQVFLNLFVNAFQAIETAQRSEGLIRVSTCKIDQEVVIEMEDNGCGIDPRNLPQLFDPFYTTKPVGEGTGLGLSITHGIITGHGGRIEVDSRLGEGSRFRIFLPLHSPARPS